MNIPATPTLPPTAQSHTSPAKAARGLLDTRSDLGEQPFGKLVALQGTKLFRPRVRRVLPDEVSKSAIGSGRRVLSR